ncbi:MAG: aldo/keto reductase, partial [Melioribacteraceae bacterium]|nr:aldo/keto reductase [Melioribacteraceae bacterium]
LKQIVKGKNLIIKEALANGRILRNQKYPHYNELYSELERLANKYEVGTDAIALRFCLDSFEDSTVLSGASEQDQLKQNLKAAIITLSSSELNNLQSFGLDKTDYWNERKKLDWV